MCTELYLQTTATGTTSPAQTPPETPGKQEISISERDKARVCFTKFWVSVYCFLNIHICSIRMYKMLFELDMFFLNSNLRKKQEEKK